MSEASEIKRLGAKAVKNSGRGLMKGDCILEPFLIDIKEYANSFSVSRDNWAKLQADAIQNGRRQPMFYLSLGKQDETPLRVWVISDQMGREMLEAWEEKYGTE